MTQNLTFLILGLGNGAVLAAFGLSLAVFHRSSGVVNFATGAIGMYGAYTYEGLRTRGELFNPIFGLPAEVSVANGPLPVVAALVVTTLISVVLGLLCYLVVFRWLQHARALAKAVASVGVMLVLEGVVALRLGTDPTSVPPIFGSHRFTIGNLVIPADRIWTAAFALVLLVVAIVVYNLTRFGMVTKAVVESEKGSLIVGISPDRVALANWGVGAAIAGLAGAVVSPLVPLTASGFTLLVIPALAVALVGRFTYFVPIVITGLLLGMVQSLLGFQSSKSWYPDWLGTGAANLLPLVIVLVVLLIRSSPLPARGLLTVQALPEARAARHVAWSTSVGFVLGLLALVFTSGSYRAALTTSFVLSLVALSFVVVTGFVGQISFAQYSLAGVSALLLARMTTEWGIPFPIAPILAALCAGVIGVVIGLPAVRVRGVNLAVVTIASAIAIESIYFNNNQLNGGTLGARVSGPRLFGIDLRIGSGHGYPRLQFGILALVVLVLVALAVTNLRRSRLGAQMLAVRANERAAAANGINVTFVKLAGFGISACIAGLGGAMIGYQQTVISGSSFVSLNSILMFAVCYISGITTVTGAIVAGLVGTNGLVFVILDRHVNFGDYYLVVTGLLLIFAIIQHPEGIGGAVQGPFKRLGGRLIRAGRQAPPGDRDAGVPDPTHQRERVAS